MGHAGLALLIVSVADIALALGPNLTTAPDLYAVSIVRIAFAPVLGNLYDSHSSAEEVHSARFPSWIVTNEVDGGRGLETAQ